MIKLINLHDERRIFFVLLYYIPKTADAIINKVKVTFIITTFSSLSGGYDMWIIIG